MASVGGALRQLRGSWRRRTTSPFAAPERPLLVHSCHHKGGTVWFRRILGSVADDYGMRLEVGTSVFEPPRRGADILLDGHSVVDRSALGAYRGSHVVRDPRDTVVSAYHYHLWTDERWVQEPRERWGGVSYQAHLRRLSEHDGIAAEIERLAGLFTRLSLWDYDDPAFLELRFEDVRADPTAAFEQIFRHYGFGDVAVDRALHWVEHHSWANTKARERSAVADRPSHLRSNRSGEWQDVLGDDHVARIQELASPLMDRLGYELA